MSKTFYGWLLQRINAAGDAYPWIGRKFNSFAINRIVNSCRYRPHPWSTAHDYVSWTSLSDKQWSARHLPAKALNLPKSDILPSLFARPDGQQRLCPKSTCLFPSFAQYLTDSFIRTRMPKKDEPDDPTRKQNTSNHDIDLSPLYGRTNQQTLALRHLSNNPGERGRLKSQIINGEEYAPFLIDETGKVKPEFDGILDLPLRLEKAAGNQKIMSAIFAFGGDRANASPQVAMMNTLFLREHNRLAAEIERLHGDWDDERVFQVARNANIVIFIKIVVEDYINHISPGFKFRVDPKVAWRAPWNKPNWITTEFSLLYRWHSLIPDVMCWDGKPYPIALTIMNNALLVDKGLRKAFVDMSAQPAGQIGPLNTAAALIDLEKIAIDQGRLCKLASYSDYREYVGLPRPSNFKDVSTNPKVVKLLETAYNRVEDIEFYVGLFCEDLEPNTPLPPLLGRMVAIDAFSQALTNPLLSEHVWQERTFSSVGWRAIADTKSLRDVVIRNSLACTEHSDFIGMTRPDWSLA